MTPRRRHSVILCVMIRVVACLFFFMTFHPDFARAQHGSRTGFRSPLAIPLNLSGNFGEFRSNHFHTGLDLKTQGREGLEVFAVTGGCVSRIRVGPYGYGNALYIDHPNGYTSVYAHLSSFNDEIEAYLRKAQYDLESWEVDLYPAEGTLCVDSSAVIAKSGNSGSSGGPHLHFEIRETESEWPVNPLLWDFPVADHRAPLVKGAVIAPLSKDAFVQGSQRDQLFLTRASSGEVSLLNDRPIEVHGPVGIGIHTVDLLDGNSNVCGVFRIDLYLNDTLVYAQQIDHLDFSTNRQLYAHADYARLKREKLHVHRTFRLPANRLPIYKTIRNNGELLIKEGELAQVRAEVSDVHGNMTTLTFRLKGGARGKSEEVVWPEGTRTFRYDRRNFMEFDSCSVYIPEGVLYDDTPFWISRSSGRIGRKQYDLAPYFEVGNPYEPVNDTFLVRITPRAVDVDLESKLLVLKYDPAKGRYSARGGQFVNGAVTARVKEFGVYTLGMDTVPPVIRPIRIDRSRLEYKVTDDLSGVAEIRAEVDGKWIRMQYDPKRNLVWHDGKLDGVLTADHRSVVLRVYDERGNKAEHRAEF